MKENTPPRAPEISDEDDLEIIPIDDGEFDLEEDEDLEELENMEEMPFEEWAANEQQEEDDALLVFKHHSSSGFSCGLHPSRDWAVTGGEDDRAYVWHTKTGEIIFEIKDHTDTVIEARFNYDGNYMATGDMAGHIFVYKVNDVTAPSPSGSGDASSAAAPLSLVWQYEMGDMAWMRWHYGANVLLAGSENGEVYIWRIPTGECKILPAAGSRCVAGELMFDGKKLFTAYADGVLKLWNLKTCQTVMEIGAQHPMALKSTVTAIACDEAAPLFAAGDENGNIVFCTPNGYAGCVQADDTVERLAFAPSSSGLQVCVSGTLKGQIAIWDYSRYTMRTLCEHEESDEGITALQFINAYTFVVATLSGHIYGYDVRTGLRKFRLLGHFAEIYELCYDKRENVLLSVSEDLTARIFTVPDLN